MSQTLITLGPYRGYRSRIEWCEHDKIYFGRLDGIRDIIGFHAETIEELPAVFREAVEDYLETCSEIDKEAEIPFAEPLRVAS